MNQETLKFLAGKISAIAVLMKDRELAVCISSNLDEKDAKDFAQFVSESLACSGQALRYPMNGENKE